MDAPPYLHEMEQRLQALERQNRALKLWIAVALIAALGAGALAGYPMLDDVGQGHARISPADGRGQGGKRSRRDKRRPTAPLPAASGGPLGPAGVELADEINDPFGTQNADSARINEIIRQEQQTLLTCVREETRLNPGFTGRFSAKFSIQPSGRVSDVLLAGATGAGPGLLACVRTTVARWRFPRFSGNPLDVSVPLIVSR